MGLLTPDNRLLFQYAPMFVVGIVAYLHWYSNLPKHPIAYIIVSLCLLQIGFTFDWFAAVFILFSLILITIRFSKNNPIVRIGTMGYSLYLIHGAAGGSLLYFLSKNNASGWYITTIILSAIALSILASILFYRIIERPSIKWAKRINFRTKTINK
jgi:peptidoglycan/LPS O-acetylase OafA/YrhL